jgi:outer membrane protein OmpA-like peptidoglycan-associated protein
LTLKGDTIKVEKFYLNSHTIIDFGLQEVLFKFNSLTTVRNNKIVPFTDLPADSAITAIIALLNDNPKIILRLSGHCDSREQNPVQLSQQRADLVANMIIKKGVSKGRLIIKGFGDEQLLVSNDEIARAKQLEKEALHQINRRVSFSVASFD